MITIKAVIPAKAGTHRLPQEMGPRFRGDDDVRLSMLA